MTEKPSNDPRVIDAKDTAVRELDLMIKAIAENALKKALFHQKLANAAIDEMMLSNKMVEQKDDKMVQTRPRMAYISKEDKQRNKA